LFLYLPHRDIIARSAFLSSKALQEDKKAIPLQESFHNLHDSFLGEETFSPHSCIMNT